MIDCVGVNCLNQGDIVDMLSGMRQQFTHPHAGFAVLTKPPSRTEERAPVLEGTVHEGKPFAGEVGIGDGLAVERIEPGLCPVFSIVVENRPGNSEHGTPILLTQLLPLGKTGFDERASILIWGRDNLEVLKVDRASGNASGL